MRIRENLLPFLDGRAKRRTVCHCAEDAGAGKKDPTGAKGMEGLDFCQVMQLRLDRKGNKYWTSLHSSISCLLLVI
jgi:hypothetical protein